MLGVPRAKALSYSAVKLFSKNSNQCEKYTSTLQTDGQTTYDGNTALCVASRGKNNHLHKQQKYSATGCILRAVIASKCVCGRVSAVDHTGGANSVPQDLAGFGEEWVGKEGKQRDIGKRGKGKGGLGEDPQIFRQHDATVTSVIEPGSSAVKSNQFQYFVKSKSNWPKSYSVTK